MSEISGGRWRGHEKARVADSCLTVSIGEVIRGYRRSRTFTGHVNLMPPPEEGPPQPGQLVGSRYLLRLRHDDGLPGYVEITHGGALKDGERKRIVQTVRLEFTCPNFSGKRWWFCCPYSRLEAMTGRREHMCGRRVGKLYLPMGETLLGCRHCHHLTYTSAQEHDKRIDEFIRNPEMVERLRAKIDGAEGPSSLRTYLFLVRAEIAMERRLDRLERAKQRRGARRSRQGAAAA